MNCIYSPNNFYDIFDEVNGVNDTRVENNLDEEAYEHYDNNVKNLTYEDWKLGHFDKNRYESKLSGHVRSYKNIIKIQLSTIEIRSKQSKDNNL